MQLSKSLKKRWKRIRNLSYVLVLLGAGCNLLALATNDGKMPVLSGDSFCWDSKHICYTSFEQVNHWYLTDGIVFFDRIFMSIGDILITIGFCFQLYLLGFLTYHFYKQKLLGSNISTSKH